MPKSFPPLEGYSAHHFAVVVRAKKSFVHMGHPLSSLCPLLSSLCGESRGDGKRGVGERLRRPPTPPILSLSPRHAAKRRGEGARGAISRWMARRSSILLGRKTFRPRAKNLSLLTKRKKLLHGYLAPSGLCADYTVVSIERQTKLGNARACAKSGTGG